MFPSGAVPATFASLTLAIQPLAWVLEGLRVSPRVRRMDRNRWWLSRERVSKSVCKSAWGDKLEKFITLSVPLKKLALDLRWGRSLQKG